MTIYCKACKMKTDHWDYRHIGLWRCMRCGEFKKEDACPNCGSDAPPHHTVRHGRNHNCVEVLPMIQQDETVTVTCLDCDHEYDVTYEPHKKYAYPIQFKFCVVCGSKEIAIENDACIYYPNEEEE